MRTLEIEIDGRKFLWNGSSWTDDRFLAPPTKVRNHLMGRLIRKLKRAPNRGLDLKLVTAAARACSESGQLEDAALLARRALRAAPKHVEAAVVLAGIARKQRKPKEALEMTAPFTRRRSAELHTLRAAAYADLGDWAQAEKAVKRALSIEPDDPDSETLRVMARVMSAKVRSTAA